MHLSLFPSLKSALSMSSLVSQHTALSMLPLLLDVLLSQHSECSPHPYINDLFYQRSNKSAPIHMFTCLKRLLTLNLRQALITSELREILSFTQ